MASYKHLISGAVGDVQHQAGDPVDPSTPAAVIDRWLAAGVIREHRTPVKPGRKVKINEHADADADRNDDSGSRGE